LSKTKQFRNNHDSFPRRRHTVSWSYFLGL
jgi:hypothetical protein